MGLLAGGLFAGLGLSGTMAELLSEAQALLAAAEARALLAAAEAQLALSEARGAQARARMAARAASTSSASQRGGAQSNTNQTPFKYLFCL